RRRPDDAHHQQGGPAARRVASQRPIAVRAKSAAGGVGLPIPRQGLWPYVGLWRIRVWLCAAGLLRAPAGHGLVVGGAAPASLGWRLRYLDLLSSRHCLHRRRRSVGPRESDCPSEQAFGWMPATTGPDKVLVLWGVATL